MSTKKIQIIDSIIKQAENADTLDGKHADEFALASDVVEIEEQLSTIPVFETREEIFNQTLTTAENTNSATITDDSTILQPEEKYYITINGTTYQSTPFVTSEGVYILSNSLSADDPDFVAIQGDEESLLLATFGAPGTYSLVISAPVYHELDDKYLPDYPVVEIDTELSESSENPIQNKVVTEALNCKMDNFENLPAATQGSYNAVAKLEFPVNTNREPDSDMGETVYAPMKMLFSELYELIIQFNSSSDLIEGSIASCITRLAELLKNTQTKAITDTGEYFTDDTVEGALQEIGVLFESLNAYDVADVIKMNTKQSALSTECNKLLANIKENCILSASSSIWDDMPTTSGCVFINWRYGTNYNIQLAFNQTTGILWRRVINRNTGAVYNDWKQPDGTPLMKILALGDSICYGARNSNKGFVGDLGFPYKNIGVSSATISNVTTTVTNIPDQLVNVKAAEPDYTPDIIIGEGGINDWSKGATLGTLSAIPVSTDAEAEALDRSTVMGGLEYLFYKMISHYPKAQRFFLITHKTYKTNVSSYCPTTRNSAGWTQQDLHDAIIECCKAYNVKVIDIYNDSIINSLFGIYRSATAYNNDNSVTNTEYVDYDGVHPLAYGYKEGYVPIIRKVIGIGTAKE